MVLTWHTYKPYHSASLGETASLSGAWQTSARVVISKLDRHSLLRDHVQEKNL